ncbi:aminotransferase class I/II-fold pyridoxal phosphate-dependent enzyme [uncultured Megasphaera sp.]|uniref:aminotransferase class I/II-fold pyridoxal phosphate-dependent enzyme n=1 Tax=uncultured Megasphaera sp. TaxID=165188 RepID=UPI002658A01D|nr:aminotransferase class I/II-fold pyridoxal phosphate-dependent enzyme [uncultured Megasphaera sp.]
MDRLRQQRAPFAEALEAYCAKHMVPFHTPGHKAGNGAPAYEKALFGDALRRDLGLMYALDDLFQPEGPLKEAMELAADLYGAGQTFFSINGTTACIEAMILAVCRRGDEIIIPREAHRSVMGGLVLSGAVPVYMESRFAEKEQISLGPDLASLQQAIAAHPQAKAVLFTYPTYDGIAVKLTEMTAYAHAHGLMVLVDEAHGAHLPFSPDLPASALSCGADCTAQSTHKLTGSLTQTSMLHCRRGFPLTEKVRAAMALVQSTSPHYWFLASLDSARQQLALYGEERIAGAVALARKIRNSLNQIPGIHSFGREILSYDSVAALDETKVTIDFAGLGLDGRQAEQLLRREGIEVELVAAHHVLALITLGDDAESAAALVRACTHIAGGRQARSVSVQPERPLPRPEVVVSPQDAWNGDTECIPLDSARDCIAAETITFYPPGIPVIALGERMTAEVLTYIREKMAAGYTPNGPADGSLRTIRILKR